MNKVYYSPKETITEKMKKLLLFIWLILQISTIFSSPLYSQTKTYLLKKNARIREQPSEYSYNIADNHDGNQLISVLPLKSKGEFWKVSYKDTVGYVHPWDLLAPKTVLDSIETSFKEIAATKKSRYYNDFLARINLKTKAENVEKFYTKFFSIKEKGEFESSDQFYKRTALDTSKVFIFNIDLSVYGEDLRYDADREILSVPVLKEGSTFIIKKDFTKGKSYTASNALGTKKTVSVYYSTEYRLRFVNNLSDFLKLNEQSTFISANISCPREEARELKSTLRCRVGFSFESYRYRQTEVDSDTPTISNPTEINYLTYRISGILRFLIFFDTYSKKVYECYLPNIEDI